MKNTQWFLLTCSLANAAHAEEYTPFHPVPEDKMRAMSTERPSKTDSAITLDAGHVQIETSLVNDNGNEDCSSGACTKTRERDVGAITTLRLGLTQSSEFQILFDANRDVTISDKSAGTRSHANGFGDTTLRYKYNFWGNDGGDTALALVAYTKLPTNQEHLANNAVEGGFELPFLFNFNNGWSLGGMTQVAILSEQSAARNDYMGYVNALVLNKNLTDYTSAYTEFYTFFPDTGERNWQNTLDFGVVHKLNDRVQIDTGMNLGITNAATDKQWFAGVSYRF